MTAFDFGYAAALAFQARSMNPYHFERTADDFEAWDKGFKKGQRELNAGASSKGPKLIFAQYA